MTGLFRSSSQKARKNNTEYKNEIIKNWVSQSRSAYTWKEEKNYIFIVARNVISLVKKTQWTERDIGSCFCCDLCIASEEERTNLCDKTRLELSVDSAVKKQPRHSLKANNQVVSRLWNFCNLCPCEGVEIAKLTENLFLDIRLIFACARFVCKARQRKEVESGSRWIPATVVMKLKVQVKSYYVCAIFKISNKFKSHLANAVCVQH